MTDKAQHARTLPNKVEVLVKPGARREAVEPLGDALYRVSVSAPPHEGEANAAVLKALAKHLGLAPSRLRIVRGAKSRKKLIEIAH